MALAINFTSNTFDFDFDVKTMKTSSTNAPRSNIRLKSRKCLFGPTNQEETYQMVKENFDNERERFFQRFGIHMEDLDRLAVDEEEFKRMKYRPVMPTSMPTTSSASNVSGGGKIVNRKMTRMKRALKPYNANNQPQQHHQQQQMKITDFCQVKKSPTSSILSLDAKKLPQLNQ